MDDAGSSVSAPHLTNDEDASPETELTRKISQSSLSTLSAHNINYCVKVKKRFYSTSENKQILFDVTGIFKPGMNAILGPTGCGKSSFLDLLAGRVDYKMVEGKLLLNGKLTPENFKCMVGYVVQDDIVMGTLTVRENFAFSAALRLPSSVSAADRMERVEDVIKELGLTKCADTKVGSDTTRGVSGGERKRCNIGMELIIRPPVLFLDEPTTGLDANTANTVLRFLKRLSDRGRTVIFSIHQPRYSIYRQFDNLMLLWAGRTVYHGPADQALEFFHQQGYVCQAYNNPPDFFLDVIMGNPSTMRGGSLNKDDKVIEKANHQEEVEAQQNHLLEGFIRSPWYQSLHQESDKIYTKYEESPNKDVIAKIDYATPFSTQILILSIRTLKNIMRNPQTGATTFLTVIFFSAIVCAIYNNISDNPETAFYDRKGCLFFILIDQIFLNMAAVETFISERALFLENLLRHPAFTNFPRVDTFMHHLLCSSAWRSIVSKAADISIPVMVLVFWQLAIYFRLHLQCFFLDGIRFDCTIGFRPGAEDFFMFVLTLFAMTIAATSLCFLYAAVFKVLGTTQILLSVTYVLMTLFSGFLVGLNSIEDWLRWLKYFSVVRYALENLYINEFKNREFCAIIRNATICEAGNVFLEESEVSYTDWDFWKNIIAMMIFAFLVFILTYISLLVTKKHR